MSKKKNTLKDLDEFLKQQAATLVTPPRLSDQVQAAPRKESAPVKEILPREEELPEEADEPVSAEKLLHDLQLLAQKEGSRFRHRLYDIIIQSVEAQNQYSVEDRMLINTALYLKSGDRWKDSIREYWRKKNIHAYQLTDSQKG